MPIALKVDVLSRLDHPTVHYGCSSKSDYYRLRPARHVRAYGDWLLGSVYETSPDATECGQVRGHCHGHPAEGTRGQDGIYRLNLPRAIYGPGEGIVLRKGTGLSRAVEV
jgi:hypothetical protein